METFPESTYQPITTNQQQQNTHWPCPKCRFIDYSMVGAGVHFFPLFLCALCYRWHSWAFVGMCVCVYDSETHPLCNFSWNFIRIIFDYAVP